MFQIEDRPKSMVSVIYSAHAVPARMIKFQRILREATRKRYNSLASGTKLKPRSHPRRIEYEGFRVCRSRAPYRERVSLGVFHTNFSIYFHPASTNMAQDGGFPSLHTLLARIWPHQSTSLGGASSRTQLGTQGVLQVR